MKIPLYLDTETRSHVNLVTQGTYKYAEACEIIMWQYAIDDGEVVVDDYLTPELSSLLADERYEIVIHNSQFDRTVIRHCTGIDIPTSRIFDTMACAMAHSLPGSLGKLCAILGIGKDKAKDKEGDKYIQLFCKPPKVRKKNGKQRDLLSGSQGVLRPLDFSNGDQGVRHDIYAGWPTKESHPTEWGGFRNYGRLDIESMREMYKRLPRWNFKVAEREIWELDQRMNDRGVCVDLPLAHGAVRAAERAQKEYAEATYDKTGGRVISTNQRQAIIDFIYDEYGVTFDDLKSSTVRNALETDLPPGLLDLLEIRLDASKTSSSKYKRVVNCSNSDGRLRGLLQFCGAIRTGRWAGRLFQPQNLPRPTIKNQVLADAIADIKSGAIGLISDSYTVMEACSSALRGVIIAPEYKKLFISDLSNIEGRVLAWLAGEIWKIKAFRDFDSGKGHDLYNLTYAKAFGIPVEDVTDDLRQIGKVMELAFGYQGGVGAWITFALAYGIDLEVMAKKAINSIPADMIADSRRFLSWTKEQKKSTYGLSETAFIVCNSFKEMWRAEHTHIADYWKGLERACIKAMNKPGESVIIGMHKIRLDGAWLRIGLPSGRCLCYPHPKLIDGKLTYEGINQYTHKWGTIKTYGGKLAENITQAVARDVLAYGMLGVEKLKYEILLTVHDEIIAEAPDTDEFSAEGLADAMSKPPIWAIDLPLAAKGFEAYRYRK